MTRARSIMSAVALACGLAIAPTLAFADADSDPAPPAPPQHEILYERPSGFWTSNRPAVGGAYRYRLLGIGVVVAAGMGVLMWRLVKRARPPAN